MFSRDEDVRGPCERQAVSDSYPGLVSIDLSDICSIEGNLSDPPIDGV